MVETKSKGEQNRAVIILAAGLGTRMKSKKAKVLHEIKEKPMILYVVDTAEKIVRNNVIVVVGYQADIVKSVITPHANVTYAYQEKQMGTGHAVLCALPYLNDQIKDVIVLCGDVPLLSQETISQLIQNHEHHQRDISVLAVKLENPFGYGRIIFDENGNFSAIIEESDADDLQKEVNIVNTGIYCISASFLRDSIGRLKSVNKQGEMYLTDLIQIGYIEHKKIGVMTATDPEEFIGVNSREDLMSAEQILNRRKGKIS